jgi:hypothetical protein
MFLSSESESAAADVDLDDLPPLAPSLVIAHSVSKSLRSPAQEGGATPLASVPLLSRAPASWAQGSHRSFFLVGEDDKHTAVTAAAAVAAPVVTRSVSLQDFRGTHRAHSDRLMLSQLQPTAVAAAATTDGSISGRSSSSGNSSSSSSHRMRHGGDSDDGARCVSFADGEYAGETDGRGRRQGSGRMEFVNGNVYWGHFEAGDPHGCGVFVYSNGDRYEGEIAKGRRNGIGKLLDAHSNAFEGRFVLGILQGRGEYKYASGGSYAGEYVDGCREGCGVVTYPNGDKYEGHFKHGLCHGAGTLTCRNGVVFRGEFLWGSRIIMESVD